MPQAPSTEWLGWVAILCELGRVCTYPIKRGAFEYAYDKLNGLEQKVKEDVPSVWCSLKTVLCSVKFEKWIGEVRPLLNLLVLLQTICVFWSVSISVSIRNSTEAKFCLMLQLYLQLFSKGVRTGVFLFYYFKYSVLQCFYFMHALYIPVYVIQRHFLRSAENTHVRMHTHFLTCSLSLSISLSLSLSLSETLFFFNLSFIEMQDLHFTFTDRHSRWLYIQPTYLSEILPETLALSSGRNLRRHVYPFPRINKSSTLQSFLPRATVFWNELPASIQSSSSLHSFKAKLRDLLKI